MLGSSSILYGGENGAATTFVNCKRIIQQSSAKAIYEVTWDGKPAIAKCWSPSRMERCAAVSVSHSLSIANTFVL